MQRSTFSHNSKNQHCCCCNFEIAQTTLQRETIQVAGEQYGAVILNQSEASEWYQTFVHGGKQKCQTSAQENNAKRQKNVIIRRAKPWIIPQVTVISLYIFSSHVTDYIHVYFVIKLRNNVWNHCCQRTAVRTLCRPAERMWILWHPPFAYNTQRLSEKWTACGDLLEFTSRGPQEAIHVFRMSSKNGVMSKTNTWEERGRAWVQAGPYVFSGGQDSNLCPHLSAFK